MKVAVGARVHAGPWGGGNRFVRALVEALIGAGHVVAHDLEADDLDLILMTDPRPRAPHVAFAAGAVLRYLAWKNPNAVVVHRVNECDERKGIPFINARLARANYAADTTVFVGRWLADLPLWRTHLRPPWFVIRNGADTALFHRRGFVPWPGAGKLRLVTHHWGYHENKGFDVYRRIDAALAQDPWRDRIAFTYVGQLPRGFAFANASHVPPLDGAALAGELRRHHAYLTASVNEPGGHHQNEGALCGLPPVFRRSGCMPEYCAGFGESFDGPGDVLDAIQRMMDRYREHSVRVESYPHTAQAMTAAWLELFERLAGERDTIVGQRRLWRDPRLFLRNQLPF